LQKITSREAFNNGPATLSSRQVVRFHWLWLPDFGFELRRGIDGLTKCRAESEGCGKSSTDARYALGSKKQPSSTEGASIPWRATFTGSSATLILDGRGQRSH
jgi:hypothetical protein